MVDSLAAHGDGVEVRLFNDQDGSSTVALVEPDLAALFAYSRSWAAEVKQEGVDLTFSSMLAAMVAADAPLCRWLVGFFDRLGVDRTEITKGRVFPGGTLPAASGLPELRTTVSFRTAWTSASRRCEPGTPVGVRHFMAAYAVSPDYHLDDFRRYRIDRREWCLELADELARRYPGEEDTWREYASEAPELADLVFDNDMPTGSDLLHLRREVETIARLVASRKTTTPLSIAVFGAWGSGKSFFLNRVREETRALASRSAGMGTPSPFHARVAHVQFNAWHYGEDELVASLVAHIFRNLRIDMVDEDEQELQRRAAALMAQLRETEDVANDVDARYQAAAQRHREAVAQLAALRSELPAAVAGAEQAVTETMLREQAAKADLSEVEQRRNEAVRAAHHTAIAGLVVGAVAGDETSTIGTTVDEVSALAEDARSLRTRGLPIVIGVVLLVASAVLAFVVSSDTRGKVLVLAGGIGALASLTRAWLSTLRRWAAVGDRFTSDVAVASASATTRVDGEFADEIAELRRSVENARNEREAAEERLRSVTDDAGASAIVESTAKDMDAARRVLGASAADIRVARRALDDLSIDSLLGEYLDERAGSDTYESHLGLLSRVSSDFERLSRMIARADADHLVGRGPAPAVSRIVLYIDDLDRCRPERVVEVIRAVHLLLAFPLFVCIVAVDPRWLSSCLEQAPGIHSPLVDDDDAKDGRSHHGSLAAEFGRPAGPADYIEKIFQVPIWLRPVPVDRRAGLLRSWLGAEILPDEDGPPVAVTRDELAFLTALAERLDGKPRTLKRLANAYRLTRAGLSDVGSKTFLADHLQPNDDGTIHRPYRTCLTLLAVLCGNRDEAIRMVQSLDSTRATTVDSWLNELANDDPVLAEFLTGALRQAELCDLRELRQWLERTRRYSFYL